MSLGAQSTWIKANLEFGHDQNWEQGKTVSTKPVFFPLTDQAVQRFSLSMMRFNSVHTMFELGVLASRSVTSGNLGDFADLPYNSVVIGSIEQKTYQLMMEYGFNISPSKSQPNAVRSIWAAFFLNPYYKELRFYNPKRTLDYPIKNYVTGFGIGLTPRLLLPLGSNFLLDFSTKITLASFQIDNYTNENPAFTPRQRKSSIVDTDLSFTRIFVRLGLAWKFPSRKKKIKE
jgi:hypothetical protein